MALSQGDDICVEYEKAETSLFASSPELMVKGKRLGLGQKNQWTEKWAVF